MTARRGDNDEAWINDLRSNDLMVRDDAARDLGDMLRRGLGKALSKRGRIDEAFLDDVCQDACIKIIDNLGTFAGRSKFRTWAVTIAVHTALSSMRKRDWHHVSLESMSADSAFDPGVVINSPQKLDQENDQAQFLKKLEELIGSELTQKQWLAITAELHGMPLSQIAEKLGSNANSLYKLMHDARRKLRHSLEASGFTIDDVHEAWA
jgi:RNA polymerase sigma-70 factor, ECF subfamily